MTRSKDESESSQPSVPAVHNNAPIGQQIINQGRAQFYLGGAPLDWSLLTKQTTVWCEGTRDTIGSDLQLERPDLDRKLAEALIAHRVVPILGSSGVGKSALVKKFILSGATPCPVYCLYADELAKLDAQAVATGSSLAELIAVPPSDQAILVVDGAERFLDGSLMTAARVIRGLGLSNPDSKWKLVITCQLIAWDVVRSGLREHQAGLGAVDPIVVLPLEDAQLRAVRERFPQLTPLFLRSELRPLITQAKVLDLLASAISEGDLPTTERWVGESNVIEWFWESRLRGGGRGDRHSAFLQKLARDQADRRGFKTLIVDLPEDTTNGFLDELKTLGVIIRHGETIRFSHDLYADQARQRFLLAAFRANRMEEVRSRVSNPHWHRAIRLLALHLLEMEREKDAPSITAWWSLVQVLRGESIEGAGVDLALEGSVFAAEPRALLDEMAPHLYADGGVLLRRLLVRFFYATSLPREDVLEGLEEVSPVVRAHIEARYRQPNLWLWIPIISWVIQRPENILKHAPNQFMLIADPWLQIGRHYASLSGVREVAAMVLTLAEREAPRWRHQEEGEERVEDRKLLFRLALFCGSTHRERLEALVLRLSGRVVSPTDTEKVVFRPLATRYRPRSRATIELPEIPKPWPHGPMTKPNGDFQEVALTQPGAGLLIELGAEFAKETFWALLIEPPREDVVWGYSSVTRELQCELQELGEARPPFYTFAPAALLLEKHPDVGLDFITYLIDFATEQWVKNWPQWQAGFPSEESGIRGSGRAAERMAVELEVAGVARAYYGDGRTFEWHRGGSQGCPVAASLLMALEHWLYEQDDKEPSSTGVLEVLLRSSRSVAILGVLFDVALRNPALLVGPLEPLVTAPEIYYWSRLRPGQVRVDTALIDWSGRGEEAYRKALEWHQFPHRKRDFAHVVAQVFAFKRTEWAVLERARQRWVRLRDSSNSDRTKQWLNILISDFDRTNWRVTPTEDGQQVLVEFGGSQQTVADRDEAELLEDRARFRYFPMRCRKILDAEETINEAELLELLSYIERTHEVDVEESFFSGGLQGIQCAAATVAIVRFPEWLDRRPEWAGRMRNWLLVSTSQIQRSVIGPEHGLGSFTWDAFCGDSVPILWARSPDDQPLREAIASLLMAPHEDAVQRVFAGVAARRNVLGDDFWRLLHLGFKLARVLKIVRNSHPQTGIEVRAQQVIRRMSDAFVSRALEPLPASWPDIATVVPDELREREPAGSRMFWPGFAENYFRFCLRWLDDEVRNTKAPDRAAIAALLEQVMGVGLRRVERQPRRVSNVKLPSVPDTQVLVPPSLESIARDMNVGRSDARRIGPISILKRGLVAIRQGLAAAWKTWRGGDRLDVVPHPELSEDDEDDTAMSEERFGELDRDVARWCAAFVVYEPDPGTRRKVSEGCLHLPHHGGRWVEEFLREVYRQGMDQREFAPHFQVALFEIFDSTIEVLANTSREKRAYRERDVLCALVGADGWTPIEKRWTAEREPLARALRTRWQRWSQLALTMYGCAERFIALLRSPASRTLRVDALAWLNESNARAWIRERSSADALFGLLEVVRVEHEVELASSEAARSSFEALLHALVDIQHAPAILLTQKLSSSA